MASVILLKDSSSGATEAGESEVRSLCKKLEEGWSVSCNEISGYINLHYPPITT